jgi:hypothetical protein
MGKINLACDVRVFHSTVTIRYGQPELACSRFRYHAYRQLCSVSFACEADGRIFFITSIFLLVVFFIIFN